MSMCRRYVVGNDSRGRSDVLFEDDLDRLPQVAAGVEGRDLWLNDVTPAPLGVVGDPSAAGPLRHEPPAGGAAFRIMRLQPHAMDRMNQEQMQDVHERLNSTILPSSGELAKAKHPSMHQTNTLNYFVVTSGEVWMLTEGRDVLLRAGDAVIQSGGVHGWRNDGPAPCTIVGVLIAGKGGA